jgi:ribonuclease HII
MENISKKLISPSLKPNPLFYEESCWQKQAYICGIDEVGRGCLAGPVITAAVILFPFATHPLLKDSKILTEKKRFAAAQWILKNSWFSYGIIDNTEIDRINIYKATQEAMRQAVYGLFSQKIGPWTTKTILIDAMPLTIPHLPTIPEIISFPYGESRSISIAAASILAKVKRDELISRMSKFFPGYQFEEHKGYGTAHHQEALHIKGPSLLHRATFIKNLLPNQESHETSTHKQGSLFR